MTLTITVEMDGSAFESNAEQAIERILQGYTEKILAGEVYTQTLRDVNGNTVGRAVVTDQYSIGAALTMAHAYGL